MRDRIGEVSYGAKFVLSDDQQKILRYPNDSYDVGSYYKGEHLNDIWGLTTIGIAKSQEEMDAHWQKSINLLLEPIGVSVILCMPIWMVTEKSVTEPIN